MNDNSREPCTGQVDRRVGVLETLHGSLLLPVFLPDATRAAVKTVDPSGAISVGVRGLVVSTFHLRTSPGITVVSALGGIHRFMAWDRPVLSDSGGFQLYSLLAEDGTRGTISTRGFAYKSERDGERELLTPEKAISAQLRLGADIIVCLDHCTHPDASKAEQEESVRHTVAWARECKEAFLRITDRREHRPLLFAVVQGGTRFDLRRACAEELLQIGFDGYGYGGWPIRDDGGLVEAVEMVARLIPPPFPLWGLGIGKPHHLATAARMGYGLFDCVLPTRDARHGRLYVATEHPISSAKGYDHIYILDRKHIRSEKPIDEQCPCSCCVSFTRAYLHHLYRVEDPLGSRLATMHNLSFFTRLVDNLGERSTVQA